ncbi:hypothetical protein J6590_022794 [Homalodisca vitripennis]|nr:hypothetical protein J6590_022794 [Homalodisca vitripennis]
MAEDRLTGLALLNVHRDIEVCPEKLSHGRIDRQTATLFWGDLAAPSVISLIMDPSPINQGRDVAEGRDGLDSTPRRKSLASHGSRLHFLSDTITVTLHRQSPCNWPGPGRPEEAAGHPRPSDPHSVMEEGSEPESSSNTRNKYILNY